MEEIQREIAHEIGKHLPDRAIEPEELADIISRAISIEVPQIIGFQGPIPPPGMLAEYERIAPGLAMRIVDRADAEQEFRHRTTLSAQQLEATELRYLAASRLLGQLFGFLIGITAVGGGIWLLSMGTSLAGLGPVIFGLGSLVAVFVVGKLYPRQSVESDADEGQEANSDGT